MNHPFIDGNKRVGHAAMEALLMLNGYHLVASVDASEGIGVVLRRLAVECVTPPPAGPADGFPGDLDVARITPSLLTRFE